MPKISKHEEVKETYSKRIYSTLELEVFGASLDKYMRTVTHKDGSEAIVHDWPTIYLKAGVQTDRGVVVCEKMNGDLYIPLKEFENKVDQWRYMQSKKLWGEDKRYESLEVEAQKLAEDVFANW